MFERLEAEVNKPLPRIVSYGVSSNSFSLPASHLHYISVQDVLALAREAALSVSPQRAHSCRTIQLPANLVETQAFGVGGAAWFAARAGVHILINRPLNALGNQAYRLADYVNMTLEYKQAARAAEALLSASPGGVHVYNVILSAERLMHQIGALQLESFVGGKLLPDLRAALNKASLATNGAALTALQQWLDVYQGQVRHLGAIKARGYLINRHKVSENTLLVDAAMHWLLRQPFQLSVLLGARSVAYVDSISGLLRDRLSAPIKCSRAGFSASTIGD